MLLRYFYDENLAQASYLAGCVKSGEALVIDPMRNITPYLETAAKENLRITHVTETHIHADFVSGSLELAAATGAALYLSDMGDAGWKYGFAHHPNVILVRDGDKWMVGNVRIEVIHTPGHTPEHISFVLTDQAASERPMGIFTGDFLFAGDIGRPDLLEEAAGLAGTKIAGARQQFATLQRFKEWPDYLQIWPGHGAGSACGKALGAVPSTTLGYEKLVNPAFQLSEEADFVAWVLADQPEPPRYFAQMKRINKEGPALLRDLATPKLLPTAQLAALLAQGESVFDLRSAADYAQGHLPTTLSIPATNLTFSTYAGWFVDYARPLYLLMPSLQESDAIIRALRAIGIDNIPGYFAPDALTASLLNGADERLPQISTPALVEALRRNRATRTGALVLDVRGHSEYASGHIHGAANIPLGHLPQRLAELPRDHIIVTQCATGYRSHIAASWLRAHGFEKVVNLRDTLEEWSKWLPPVQDPIQEATRQETVGNERARR